MSYTGWEILNRNELLKIFPAQYNEIKAHHITHIFGGDELPDECTAMIIGISDDYCGLQVMVVSINGEILRPDGKIYHCTWSLLPGRNPVESNAVIANHSWIPISPPIEMSVCPKVFTY